MRGPSPADGARTIADQVLARAVHEQLQLAVLVDGAEAGDRRRALPVLAEALRPQLREPGAEAPEPVRIGHHHLGADAALARQADGDRRALGRREVARAPWRAISASTTSRAPARTARASSPRAMAGSRPTLVKTEKRPPMPG